MQATEEDAEDCSLFNLMSVYCSDVKKNRKDHSTLHSVVFGFTTEIKAIFC